MAAHGVDEHEKLIFPSFPGRLVGRSAPVFFVRLRHNNTRSGKDNGLEKKERMSFEANRICRTLASDWDGARRGLRRQNGTNESRSTGMGCVFVVTVFSMYISKHIIMLHD